MGLSANQQLIMDQYCHCQWIIEGRHALSVDAGNALIIYSSGHKPFSVLILCIRITSKIRQILT